VAASRDGELPGLLCTPGPKHRKPFGRQPVNHYAAIDVSLELSSVCIVEATGKVVKEAKVETHPEGLVKFFQKRAQEDQSVALLLDRPDRVLQLPHTQAVRAQIASSGCGG